MVQIVLKKFLKALLAPMFPMPIAYGHSFVVVFNPVLLTVCNLL